MARLFKTGVDAAALAAQFASGELEPGEWHLNLKGLAPGGSVKLRQKKGGTYYLIQVSLSLDNPATWDNAKTENEAAAQQDEARAARRRARNDHYDACLLLSEDEYAEET